LKYTFYIFVFLIGLNFSLAAQSRPVASPALRLIKFYPNPAAVGISFEFQGTYDKSYTIQLFNFMGRKVYSIENPSPVNYVSLSSFYRGVYVYQLRDRNGKIIESNKFQVVK
jgi:hypothetical protein